MQQTLEVRLTEAQNVIKSAEQEKTEKENAAMKALTEQELIMEKVLQESKILNQQAEDNSKVKWLVSYLLYLNGDWYVCSKSYWLDETGKYIFLLNHHSHRVKMTNRWYFYINNAIYGVILFPHI